jgi:hypothetical protein
MRHQHKVELDKIVTDSGYWDVLARLATKADEDGHQCVAKAITKAAEEVELEIVRLGGKI